MPTVESPPLSSAQRNLLDAATDAFAELGFGGTGTRDIAARAGRSSAAVYIHYSSKEELLFAISLRGHHDSLSALREAASEPDPVQRLSGMVFAFSQWHLRNAKLGRVVQYEFRALTDEHRAQITSMRRETRQLMIGVIKDGIEAGVFEATDPKQTADAVLSLSIDVVRWFDPERRRGLQAIARLHADLAVRMLRGHVS